MNTLLTGQILEGHFWPEPIPVLASQRLGVRIKIDAVRTKNGGHYSPVLSAADLACVKVFTEASRDFKGRAEAVFLAIEAHRIRFAR